MCSNENVGRKREENDSHCCYYLRDGVERNRQKGRKMEPKKGLFLYLYLITCSFACG